MLLVYKDRKQEDGLKNKKEKKLFLVSDEMCLICHTQSWCVNSPFGRIDYFSLQNISHELGGHLETEGSYK